MLIETQSQELFTLLRLVQQVLLMFQQLQTTQVPVGQIFQMRSQHQVLL
jgi:hypothetical protein